MIKAEYNAVLMFRIKGGKISESGFTLVAKSHNSYVRSYEFEIHKVKKSYDKQGSCMMSL